ncbi:MAG: DUF1552 domain-containing protein [Acidimicrobiia bacterium]|nr:DUF1552 domain-containing protein [Acidimicrobiia bacterium]
MIISRTALPRRTLLRGAGVALALPLLDAMVPALTATARTAAAPVTRLGFLFIPSGVSMNHKGVNHWKPSGTGAGVELSPILAPLAGFRDRLTVVSGCSHLQALPLGDGQGEHTRSSATFLNGVHPRKTQGADVRAGVTADQIAAATLGRDTALASIELSMDQGFVVGNCENGYSCVYMNTISWRTPTTPLPTEHNPRAVFERLFGEGGSPDARAARVRTHLSILDQVAEDLTRLQRRLGPADRARAAEYFDAVRDVERRLQKVETKTDVTAAPELTAPPVGIPDSFTDHLLLMFELVGLAFQADITRVFTFMYGRDITSRTYPEIGVTEGHHPLSHHGDKPERMDLYKKVNTYHASLFARLLDRLGSMPEGEGSVLDHSMLLYGSGLSDSNLHDHRDLPMLVVGGRQAGGARHVAAPIDTPVTNLLLTMLERAGVEAESLGDSTGRLDLA